MSKQAKRNTYSMEFVPRNRHKKPYHSGAHTVVIGCKKCNTNTTLFSDKMEEFDELECVQCSAVLCCPINIDSERLNRYSKSDLKENLQRQLEEIEVLQSIYLEDEFHLLNPADYLKPPFIGCLKLPVKLSATTDRFTVRFDQHRNNDVNDIVCSESRTVKFLPAVELFFLFPEGYPAHTKPRLIVRCVWLPDNMLLELYKKLIDLWYTRNGTEVIFTWGSFIQHDLMKYFNLQREIIIATPATAYSYRRQTALQSIAGIGGNGGTDGGGDDDMDDAVIIQAKPVSYIKYSKYDSIASTHCNSSANNLSAYQTSAAATAAEGTFSAAAAGSSSSSSSAAAGSSSSSSIACSSSSSAAAAASSSIACSSYAASFSGGSTRSRENRPRTSASSSIIVEEKTRQKDKKKQNKKKKKDNVLKTADYVNLNGRIKFVHKDGGQRNVAFKYETEKETKERLKNDVFVDGDNKQYAIKDGNVFDLSAEQSQQILSSSLLLSGGTINGGGRRDKEFRNNNNINNRIIDPEQDVKKNEDEIYSWLKFRSGIRLLSGMDCTKNHAVMQKKLKISTKLYLIDVANKTQFKRAGHDCAVCYENKIGRYCTMAVACCHVFCDNCIRDYVQTCIASGTVRDGIKCLEVGCDVKFRDYQLKQVLTDEAFQTYKDHKLRYAIDSNQRLTYCPRDGCDNVAFILDYDDEDEVMGHCPQCKFYFCVYCRKTYHGRQHCLKKAGERKRILEEYATASAVIRETLEQRYSKRQLTAWFDEDLTRQWIEEKGKPCPKCKAIIEKYSGCNKVVCTKCNTAFCWMCLEILKPTDPYEHYANPTSKCFDKLFLGVNVDEEFLLVDDDDDWDLDDDDDDDDDDGHANLVNILEGGGDLAEMDDELLNYIYQYGMNPALFYDDAVRHIFMDD